MKIEEQIPLSTLTTFKTGGPARFVVSISVEADVQAAVRFAEEKCLPIIPLGMGSNMVAPDSGVEAVFVRYTGDALLSVTGAGTDVEVLVHAGLLWDSFVSAAVSKGWWGIENLSGIPGTVGASAVQNIGAYGGALSESVIEVTVYDIQSATLKTLSNAECRFGYRTSIFKEETDRYFITRIRFRLSTIASPRLSYKDVAEYFTRSGEEPTLENIRNAIIGIRKEKFPPLDRYGTAGSFFLNPILSEPEAHRVSAAFPGIPLLLMPEGGVKVPLAWILDHVLAFKGARVGGAFLWEKQPLVIATDASATSRDVIALADFVREAVKKKTDIDIVPEARML